MVQPALSVRHVLSTLPKRRLVDLGRQFGVAIAKPNGVPITESVERLTDCGQLVFRDLLQWMSRDELRRACKQFGLEHTSRSRTELCNHLLQAHPTQTVAPLSPFGQLGPNRSVPRKGDVALVRMRQYLVADVQAPSEPEELTRVDLVCLDDDNQGKPLSVLWELELGARVVRPQEGLGDFAALDPPRHFAAYLHALKWNSVTATDAALFQSPFRAGIRLLNHQLIPLRKALQLPRCNLFIADDVGLGKTIEAGLVMQELQMRQRVQFTLIVCPASICLQWQREMERRFGQRFEVYDRAFVSERRRQRGFGVNPWSSHQRFIVSYHTLSRPEHREPLLQHLGQRLKKSMLVLDEAHTVAPSSPGKYATDSKLTKLVRRLAPCFENRLFLSATPHNGHSNSFSTLLELLDPQRFTRGVPVEAGCKPLEEVMVRRLKRDLQEAALGSFPTRHVVRIALQQQGPALVAQVRGEPATALCALGKAGLPELQLAKLLAEYTQAMAPQRGPGRFVFINLQKRLLSSVEAFCRTLRVHVARLKERFGDDLLAEGRHGHLAAVAAGAAKSELQLHALRWDVSRARDEDEDDWDREVDGHSAVSTAAVQPPSAEACALLRQMLALAEEHRSRPDAKVYALVDWIRAHLCSGIGFAEKQAPPSERGWAPERLIIFTEYADTKRYLMQQLQHALRRVEGEDRLMDFHGAMGDAKRDAVQEAFNGDLEQYPERILLATDAAREGLNLQNHCANLFHFDVPWNPSRMEQRNGRIDRTLQPASDVYCHYFAYPQRTEDVVLEKLVNKVGLIQRELGSLGDVVMQRLDAVMDRGIGTATAEKIDQVDTSDLLRQAAVNAQLESQRQTLRQLREQTDEAAKILNRSAKVMQFDESLLRDAVNVVVELAGAAPLKPLPNAAGRTQAFELPQLPPSWQGTLDSLRPPQAKGEPEWEWRKRPLPPVTFQPLSRVGEDRVHLHLEHPLVQRMVSRFMAQGYSAQDLSRVTVVPNDRDGLVRVIAFGRVSLFGEGATRLHDEVVSVAAQWLEAKGAGHLRPFADSADRQAVETLEELLAGASDHSEVPKAVKKRILESASSDFATLWPAVRDEAEERAHAAVAKLKARGEQEAVALRAILEGQRADIERALQASEGNGEQLLLDWKDESQSAQRKAELRAMKQRLADSSQELQTEPEQLKALYQVALQRLEPVGMVYLWPTTRM